MFQLVWNEGDPTSENRPEKLIKANYITKLEAQAQAVVDMEMGKAIVGIADSNGKLVWTSEEYKSYKSVTKDEEARSYPWRLKK